MYFTNDMTVSQHLKEEEVKKKYRLLFKQRCVRMCV